MGYGGCEEEGGRVQGCEEGELQGQGRGELRVFSGSLAVSRLSSLLQGLRNDFKDAFDKLDQEYLDQLAKQEVSVCVCDVCVWCVCVCVCGVCVWCVWCVCVVCVCGVCVCGVCVCVRACVMIPVYFSVEKKLSELLTSINITKSQTVITQNMASLNTNRHSNQNNTLELS